MRRPAASGHLSLARCRRDRPTISDDRPPAESCAIICHEIQSRCTKSVGYRGELGRFWVVLLINADRGKVNELHRQRTTSPAAAATTSHQPATIGHALNITWNLSHYGVPNIAKVRALYDDVSINRTVFFTFAKEVMFSLVAVCLYVC